jgi:hypothetical protein
VSLLLLVTMVGYVVFGFLGAIEVDREFPGGRSSAGRSRLGSSGMDLSVLGVAIVLFWAPLEVGLRLRRRGLARGWAAWRGALAVAVSTALGCAVAWWPARRWITEREVARVVARRRPPVPPEDLLAYEAWAREVAGPYISRSLVAIAAMYVMLRIVIPALILAVERRGRRTASDG